VAANRRTGEINILNSIHATDRRRHHQVEGAAAMAVASALFEAIAIDSSGLEMNQRFRGYHIPSYADVPRNSVHFADTSDLLSPAGREIHERKPAQSDFAAALTKPIRDTTGARCSQTPISLYRQIADNVST
jgi:putative selenate reductase molybdopterin-binding subunit